MGVRGVGGGTKGSQLGWHRRRARCDVSGRLALALALLWANASAPGRVAAQVPESGPDADSTLLIQTAAASFDPIGDRAAAGAWQDADEAFNVALDALDLVRARAFAGSGQEALAEVDRRVAELDVALRAEDPTRVRAAVAAIKSALAPLAPGLGLTAASGDAVATALAWRDALSALLALGDGGQWIPMRNAALDLHADILARRAPVSLAAGPNGADAVERLRIFSMRLFAASLDQSSSETATSAELFRVAMDDLLVALDIEPAPTSAATAEGGTRFRAFLVEGRPGEVVSMPLVAEGIPPSGLGGFELELRWSPTALRLVDVTWESGQGSFSRDDSAGRATLRYPQAPTGPSGRAVLAQLQFDVRAAEVGARDYLPADEIEVFESRIDEARDAIRLADVATSARRLTDAYAVFVGGRDLPGSLYGGLAPLGLAEPLAGQLLELVDLASQPAISSEAVIPIDLLVQLLSELDAGLSRALDRFAEAIAPAGTIPVLLELRSATDTRGAPLPAGESLSGRVILSPASLPESIADAQPEATPTLPGSLIEALGELTPIAGGVVTGTLGSTTQADPASPGASTGAPDGAPGLPLPLLAVLVLALAAGAVSAYLARRTGLDPPS